MKKINELPRLQTLLRKSKGLLLESRKLRAIKGPVLMLIHKDRTVTFHDDAKPGIYKINENNEEKEIELPARSILLFEGWDKPFRGFIHYEEEALPYPTNPTVTAEMIAISTNKILNDMKKWTAEEQRQQRLMVKEIAGAIIILVILYFGYQFLIAGPAAERIATANAKAIAEAALANQRNITVFP